MHLAAGLNSALTPQLAAMHTQEHVHVVQLTQARWKALAATGKTAHVRQLPLPITWYQDATKAGSMQGQCALAYMLAETCVLANVPA